jgi:hypothetical protein
MNQICKNSATPLKDQTFESWALNKETKCMQKVIGNILNKTIAEKFSNPEKDDHSGIGGLEDSKKT